MKLLLALALAVAPIAACQTVPEPGAVADQTRMDEQGRIGFGLAYVTASRLGNALSRAGVIDRARFQSLDRQAYAALLRVRAAYAAGNSADYFTAAAELQRIIGDINNLVGR